MYSSAVFAVLAITMHLSGGNNPRHNYPFPWGDRGPHPIHGPSGPLESTTKPHLDRFIRFCMAHACVQQTHTQTETDRQTDHATSVAVGRILCFA